MNRIINWRLLESKNIIYSIAKKFILSHELKNIKKIRNNSSKKRYNYSRNSSSKEPYSESSLSRYINCDKERNPSGSKEINILDHAVTDNIKTNKYQRNGTIENEPKFDGSFNLSRRTKDPLSVVTVSLQVGKKHRSMTVAGLI